MKSCSGVNDGNGDVSSETSNANVITKYCATPEAVSRLQLERNETAEGRLCGSKILMFC